MNILVTNARQFGNTFSREEYLLSLKLDFYQLTPEERAEIMQPYHFCGSEIDQVDGWCPKCRYGSHK